MGSIPVRASLSDKTDTLAFVAPSGHPVREEQRRRLDRKSLLRRQLHVDLDAPRSMSLPASGPSVVSATPTEVAAHVDRQRNRRRPAFPDHVHAGRIDSAVRVELAGRHALLERLILGSLRGPPPRTTFPDPSFEIATALKSGCWAYSASCLRTSLLTAVRRRIERRDRRRRGRDRLVRFRRLVADPEVADGVKPAVALVAAHAASAASTAAASDVARSRPDTNRRSLPRQRAPLLAAIDIADACPLPRRTGPAPSTP